MILQVQYIFVAKKELKNTIILIPVEVLALVNIKQLEKMKH